MADLGGYDPKQVADSDFDALPAGEYRAVIVESERKPTKGGGGFLLNVKLQIIDGQYKNRTVFDRFNLWNASDKAKLIAQQQFKKVCEAVNVMSPKDSSELHMKPLMIKLTVSEYDGKERNEVKAYKAALTQQSHTEEKAKTAGKPAGW